MSKDIKKHKIRVVCAMSGGVDSAVSAVLLKNSGFEVISVFMRLLDGGEENETRARDTARQLEISFDVLDLRSEFKKLVINKFISDTKKGLTSNPCVVCNEEIKFGLLVKKAMALGADYVATGHYCQIKKTKDGIYHLLKGKDKNKDQSYFLWRLNQKQLSKIIFPVGCFEKSEVRKLAKKWKLPSAATPESQEICFAAGDIDRFLEKHCGVNPGNIVDTAGKILGKHNGLWFYTIGQRKGIKLSGGPFFVAKKNRAKNELAVAASLKNLAIDKIRLADVRWLGAAPKLFLKVKAKIRYRGKEISALVFGNKLEFIKPQIAPAGGQSAVFYKGNELLGGGIIK